jgi:hypothetical protein
VVTRKVWFRSDLRYVSASAMVKSILDIGLFGLVMSSLCRNLDFGRRWCFLIST